MPYTGNNWYTTRDETGSPPKLYKTEVDNIIGHAFEKTASYIVRVNGSYYEAINGSTGKLDYGGSGDAGGVDGTDEGAVIQASITALTKGIIYVKNIAMPAGITHKDRVVVVIDWHGTLEFYGKYGHVGQTGYTDNEDRPVARFYCNTEISKPIVEWRDHDDNPIAWIVAHYKKDASTIHKHISIETVIADLQSLYTRLELTYGVDQADIGISESHFVGVPHRLMRKTLDANATSWTFDDKFTLPTGSPNFKLRMSRDRIWEIEGRINNTQGSAASISLYLAEADGSFDETTTNYYNQTMVADNNNVTAARANNAEILNVPASGSVIFSGRIEKLSAGKVLGLFTETRTPATTPVLVQRSYVYNVVCTEINKFKLVSSVANGLGSGSEIQVFSRGRIPATRTAY